MEETHRLPFCCADPLVTGTVLCEAEWEKRGSALQPRDPSRPGAWGTVSTCCFGNPFSCHWKQQPNSHWLQREQQCLNLIPKTGVGLDTLHAAANGPFKTISCHYSLPSAVVSHLPETLGSPQCTDFRWQALGSWRFCKKQRWGFSPHIKFPDGKGCCDQAAQRAEKWGCQPLYLCQLHSLGQQALSTEGAKGTGRGTKLVKCRDWKRPGRSNTLLHLTL